MKIGGIIDISTKDIPHKASMVIFTVGCNFKCEFCHNKYLLYPNAGKEIEVNELLEKISENVLINSVSITGGEPTLQEDLVELCEKIAQTGKYLSVDTNGSNPSVIENILPYINRVALDLKSSLTREQLLRITRTKIDPNIIIETFNLINDKDKIDFEVRTTYVEKILKPKDIAQIIGFLREYRFRGNFVLQQYQYSEGVGEDFKDAFQKPEHDTLLNILKPYNKIEFPFKIYLRDDFVGFCNLNELFDQNQQEI